MTPPSGMNTSDSHKCVLEEDCFDVEPETLTFPVKLEELLSLLSAANREEVEKHLKRECYRDSRKISYPPIAMLKAAACFHLQKEDRLTRFHAKLAQDAGFRKKLGFNQTPSYSQLWHFMNIRVKQGELMRLLTRLLQETGRTQGVEVGKTRVQDATFIASKNEQAEYSGYYKDAGYKLEISSDNALLLPLYADAYQCTEYEGYYAVPFQEQLKFLKTEVTRFDGGYNSLANYGMLNGYYGLQAYFNIDENTVFLDGVDEKFVRVEYDKFWREADFKVGACFQEMEAYLCFHGKADVVGGFYRNKRLLERVADPVRFGKVLHQRSLAETVNSVLKEDTSVLKRLRNANVSKGRVSCLWVILGLQLVGLVKLEHGVKRALASLKNVIC